MKRLEIIGEVKKCTITHFIGIGECDGPTVGYIDSKNDANDIVTAVNAHEELVAACKNAVEHLEAWGTTKDDRQVCDQLIAALSKAGVTP